MTGALCNPTPELEPPTRDQVAATFAIALADAIEFGIVSPQWCWVHDSPPTTEAEDHQAETEPDGWHSMCIHAYRLMTDTPTPATD